FFCSRLLREVEIVLHWFGSSVLRRGIRPAFLRFSDILKPPVLLHVLVSSRERVPCPSQDEAKVRESTTSVAPGVRLWMSGVRWCSSTVSGLDALKIFQAIALPLGSRAPHQRMSGYGCAHSGTG